MNSIIAVICFSLRHDKVCRKFQRVWLSTHRSLKNTNLYPVLILSKRAITLAESFWQDKLEPNEDSFWVKAVEIQSKSKFLKHLLF